MLPSVTPAVARALEMARAYAVGAGAGEVHPLHVLHGLLEEDEGRAAGLVIAAGLDMEAYRAGRGERQEGGAELPLSGPTADALSLAHDLALELTGDSALSSDPLLLALLRTDRELAVRLEALGLRLALLEGQLQREKPPPLRLDEPLALDDPTERMDAARILDVCANRAREALRTVEDYCRFVLDDAFLSREAKTLRHDFNALLGEHGPAGMVHARETLRDVGTHISTQRERERNSLLDVVRVNLKRLQEALRSLEEFGKVDSPNLGEQVEQVRYRAYTLERAVLLGAEARQRLQGVHVYALLSAGGCAAALDWTIKEAAAGGVGMVQLREKALNDHDLLARARDVRRWTREAGVLFIVNDRPDVARLVEADGVHLGQDDLPVKEARRILGPEAIIGVSTHTVEQVRQAVRDGAGYIGVGPTFPSQTKAFEALAGLAFVEAALAETTLPAFAIGGISAANIDRVRAAGARRVAVSHAIAQADDPRSAAAVLRGALVEG
jgi:thiamine-phosphate pyrophosphorylase